MKIHLCGKGLKQRIDSNVIFYGFILLSVG